MKYANSIAGGNRLNAFRRARDMGCSITPINGTGEYRVSHPLLRLSVRVNGRRKDAPRHLIVYLKHVAAITGHAA
jgi:hypothetical protein